MTNGDQRSMIREAMQAIAQRKPGKSKLVYDKTKRTIVAVSEGSYTPQALNITADDADMFGLVTLSSEWLREKWPELTKAGSVPVAFSSWDGGDALTQSDLCIQASPTTMRGILLLGRSGEISDGIAIHLVPTERAAHAQQVFVAPDGARYHGEFAEPVGPPPTTLCSRMSSLSSSCAVPAFLKRRS